MPLIHQENVVLNQNDLLSNRFLLESVVGKHLDGTIYEVIDKNNNDKKYWLFNLDDMAGFKWESEDHIKNTLDFLMVQNDLPDNNYIIKINETNYDEDKNTFYFIIEPIEGILLNEAKDLNRLPLGIEDGINLITKISDAISTAHNAGFLHLSLSPRCIFLCENNTPKIYGFSMPPSIRDTHIVAKLVPSYASPGMLEGEKPNEGDDIYALGCLSYLILSGNHPYGMTPAAAAKDKKMKPSKIKHLGFFQNRVLKKAVSLETVNPFNSVKKFSNSLKKAWAL